MNKEFLNKNICGNSVEILKKIEDNSIDLVVTSPPYDTQRTYEGTITNKIYDEYYSFPFVDMANELYRVVSDGGLVVWIVNDKVIKGGESGNSFRQALKFQEIGFKIYDTMIYSKNGSAYSESGRYDQVFEYMFVLLKGKKPKTVNLLKDKKNRWAGSKTFGVPSVRQKDGTLKPMKDGFVVSEYGTRYNVWYTINGKSSKDNILTHAHPASFPLSLVEDHILSWSNEGDTVLDPMMGGGTTAVAAKMNNRNFIGIDIVEKYVDIANLRVSKTNSYTKENPNPKLSFIVSREEILAKRKKNKN